MKSGTLALRLTLLCLLFNAVLVALSAGFSYGWSSFDTMTESLICDAAFNYARLGLFHDAGLPVISDDWIRGAYPHAITVENVEHVYLHYPAVPYLLGGLGAKLFGVDDIRWLRIIPLAINASLLFVFLQGVFSVLADPAQRRWFVAAFAAIPFGWAQLYGFSPNVYAHYVLLALIGAMLPLFQAGRPVVSAARGWAAAGFFGFLAGCFTWDFFFVTALAPLAVGSLYHGKNVFVEGPPRTAIIRLCFCVAAGFGLSQGLHVLQVAAYYGSLSATLMEFWNAVYFRMVNIPGHYHFMTGLLVTHGECNSYCLHITALGPVAGRITLVIDYLFRFTAVDTKQGIVFVAPIAIYLLLAAAFVWILGNETLKGRFLTLILISVTVCFLWMMLLLNYGSVHTHMLPRHFYLVYILMALFMVTNFTGPAWRRSAVAAARA